MSINIFVLHPHFLFPGGASKVVLELSSRLVKDFPVEVLTTKHAPSVVSEYGLNISQVSPFSTGNILHWLTLPFLILKANRIIKKRSENNVLFCHSLSIYWGVFLKLLNNKYKTIFYFHDCGFPYFDNQAELEGLPVFYILTIKMLSPIFKLFNKFAISKADLIIANSNYTKNYIENQYNKKVSSVIYPGVDQNIFKKGKTKDNQIYTLGRLEKSKNMDLVISSFKKYLEGSSDKDLKLLIIGQGKEQDNLLKMIKNLNLENRVILRSGLTSTQVSDIASSSLVGIFLRGDEPFGLAAAECLMSGTPVIGPKTGGISEIVEDDTDGLLTELDADAIANKINLIINNKTKFNQLPREHTKNKFSWDTNYAILKDLIIKNISNV